HQDVKAPSRHSAIRELCNTLASSSSRRFPEQTVASLERFRNRSRRRLLYSERGDVVPSGTQVVSVAGVGVPATRDYDALTSSTYSCHISQRSGKPACGLCAHPPPDVGNTSSANFACAIHPLSRISIWWH